MPACTAASATRSSPRSSSPAPPRGSACGASSTRSSATCRRPPRSRRPSPASPKSGDPVEVAPDAAGPLLVRVFKTTADPFVGRLTYLRVLSGTLRSQGHAWNAEKGEDERIGQLLRLHGKEQEPVGELKAGEIGAVAKLSATATGDTLSTKERPFVLDRPVYPNPTLVVAIEPQTKADLDKMGAGPPADARGGALGSRGAQRHRRAAARHHGRDADRGHHASA